MSIRIADREIGPEHEPYVIAEMSGNHDGSLDKALEIVRMAARQGAHAVKLQTYKPETITIESDAPDFRLSDGHELWGGRTLWDLYTEAHTPWEWHEPIFAEAKKAGITVFSSPFDPTAIDLLEGLGAPAYKIASSEIVDLPLIRAAASKGKPVIISTGMASLGEINAAVEAARSTGNEQIVVLACTANYPADPSESNLRGIPVMADAFGTLIGYSDHTIGIGAAITAVALGACVVEKHVTLQREGGGVDAAFSSEPEELAALVRETRTGWQCLGQARIGARQQEKEGLRFRRSLYVVTDVKAGDRVSADNVRSIRPANGLEPEAFSRVEGRTFRADVARGTALDWGLV
ncbi:pseudaminic acid synthase [Luteipulveratus halotolerans]|uniref:N-acetylneuraminate synthase n=1 Tax=Luteipulveratus halotolerans TaxID=1631356 RepID=A0A0L6CMU3_9MICO|nr:pseudaminic acid synthase [Luteipulveratus halotolerans]KNX39032.1 N-acetylneuraminate synthase [Luteipulveratus halotolerans]